MTSSLDGLMVVLLLLHGCYVSKAGDNVPPSSRDVAAMRLLRHFLHPGDDGGGGGGERETGSSQGGSQDHSELSGQWSRDRRTAPNNKPPSLLLSLRPHRALSSADDVIDAVEKRRWFVQNGVNTRFPLPERRKFPEVDWRGFNEDVFHESFGDFTPMKKKRWPPQQQNRY